MTSDKAQATEQRLNALLQGDAWQSVSMTNGWTATVKIRLSMDMRDVRIRFSNISPGTTTDGTTVATLPTGYRPNSDTAVPLSTDVTAGSQSPHLAIASTGVCQVYGLGGTATKVTVNAAFAIDD